MWRRVVGLAALGVAHLALGCVAHGGRPLPAPSSAGDCLVALPKPAPHGTERGPQFWVNELSTPRDVRRALERLVQLFEDARDHSNGDLTAPEVKSFIELTIEPLTQAVASKLYAIIAGESDLLDLDRATRNAPLELLAARLEGRQ